MGVSLLRLPPFHCFFNPVELCWSYLKQRLNKIGRPTNRLETVKVHCAFAQSVGLNCGVATVQCHIRVAFRTSDDYPLHLFIGVSATAVGPQKDRDYTLLHFLPNAPQQNTDNYYFCVHCLKERRRRGEYLGEDLSRCDVPFTSLMPESVTEMATEERIAQYCKKMTRYVDNKAV
ncbi:hypothetical protein OSTOST_09148 [Ostertagia ostertagi]